MIKKILPILLFFAVALQAQETCTPTELFEIKTASGMKMRNGPHQNNKVVTYVPAESYLLVCKELSWPATFEGIDGHWRRVRFMEFTGYMFDGFLLESDKSLTLIDSNWQVVKKTDLIGLDSINDPNDESSKEAYIAHLDSIIAVADSVKQYKNDSLFQFRVDEKIMMDSVKVYNDSVKVFQLSLYNDSVRRYDSIASLPPPPKTQYQFAVETYNYCGSLDDLDAGTRWYGIYFDTQVQKFKVKRINLLVIMSKYSLGSGVEFDIKSESGKSPHFMVGIKGKIDTNAEYNWQQDFFFTHPDQLYPGQQLELFAHENVSNMHNFTLYSTGNVRDVGLCPDLENYKLKLTGEMHNNLLRQDLTPHFNYMGACGMPKLYWFGDLNGDEYPDFITVAQDKEYSEFTLFISDTQDETVLVRKASQWTSIKCD